MQIIIIIIVSICVCVRAHRVHPRLYYGLIFSFKILIFDLCSCCFYCVVCTCSIRLSATCRLVSNTTNRMDSTVDRFERSVQREREEGSRGRANKKKRKENKLQLEAACAPYACSRIHRYKLIFPIFARSPRLPCLLSAGVFPVNRLD